MKIAWLPIGLREGIRFACSSRPNSFVPILRQRHLSKPTARSFSTSRCMQNLRFMDAVPYGEEPEENVIYGPMPDWQKKQMLAEEEVRSAKVEPEESKGFAEEEEEKIYYARLVPASPSYFSARPHFTDDLLMLQDLAYRYASLPVVKPGEAPRVAWGTHVDYKNVVGEAITSSKYGKIVELLNRLNHIHPALMPDDVTVAINRYKRDVNPYNNIAKPIAVQGGVATGAGRRKSSWAYASLIEGTGEVLVNGKTLAEQFGRYHDRESAIWALKATDRIDKYNVLARAGGGGTTGQAEALTLAVAKALIGHEPALKPALRRAGCVTRDPRRVERKKPGHVKARKMPAWVKR